ncbi:SRPBCC family protein [Actinocorallia sp. A-T 12471]|uniref:SRPBCC family protein n=1 Tax=Actinocorallia sp. A-T 12471 TaxID=3089813 RepID=UPI0029CDA8F9|nr:SRPBCC family protein [Actinocorallia sp. A-T 12471]MDX6738321.1 SRPBCC family protein [Actinocorallia sp. A-T 12471]
MSTIEQSIDVEVPVRTAYDQWTQFEEFPRFMEGVDRIEQVTPTWTRWETSIAGVHREFDAEITEQRPDERVAWRSVAEPRQAGVVTFHRLDPVNTRVMVQMEFDPEGFAEQAADKLNIVERRVKGDLKRFKDFIESRDTPTGAWRGEIPSPDARGAVPTAPASDLPPATEFPATEFPATEGPARTADPLAGEPYPADPSGYPGRPPL